MSEHISGSPAAPEYLKVLGDYAHDAVVLLQRTALAVAARLIRTTVPKATHIVIESSARRGSAQLLEVGTLDGVVWSVGDEAPEQIAAYEINEALEQAHRIARPLPASLGWTRVTPLRPWWRIEITDEACEPATALSIPFQLHAVHIAKGMTLATGRVVNANLQVDASLCVINPDDPIHDDDGRRLFYDLVELVDLVIPPSAPTGR